MMTEKHGKLWVVMHIPKNGYREAFHTYIKVVVAPSKKEAIYSAGFQLKREYKKPEAGVYSIGEEVPL